jgi:hypothetical protein
MDPIGHTKHDGDGDAADDELYHPLSHILHAVAESTATKVPASHPVQTVEPYCDAKVPTAQTGHDGIFSLDTLDALPGRHNGQFLDATPVPYPPATHMAQVVLPSDEA